MWINVACCFQGPWQACSTLRPSDLPGLNDESSPSWFGEGCITSVSVGTKTDKIKDKQDGGQHKTRPPNTRRSLVRFRG